MAKRHNKRVNALDLDLQEQVVALNRVAKVVEGGRRFSFAALVIVGDGKGTVGWGAGKARETKDAIRKGGEKGRQRLIEVPLRGDTIWHPVVGKHETARVLLRPAAPGTGVIAGGAARIILKSAGIKNLLAKSMGSSNAHNIVRATFDALQQLTTPGAVAKRRGISLQKVFNG